MNQSTIMSLLKKLAVSFSIILFITSCQTETSREINETSLYVDTTELIEQLEEAEADLTLSLNKKQNPVQLILSKMETTSDLDKDLMRKELKMSFDNSQARLQQVSKGELTIEEYLNDYNGAFDKNAKFKTNLGKELSKYYSKRYERLSNSKNEALKEESFIKFETVRNIQKEIN